MTLNDKITFVNFSQIDVQNARLYRLMAHVTHAPVQNIEISITPSSVQETPCNRTEAEKQETPTLRSRLVSRQKVDVQSFERNLKNDQAISKENEYSSNGGKKC